MNDMQSDGDDYFNSSGYTVYKPNTWMSVTYLVNESKLVYSYTKRNENCVGNYDLNLPQNVDGITHWYPAICLPDIGDECEITGVVVN